MQNTTQAPRTGQVVRWRSDEGCRAAIVFEGRTKVHAVYITDSGVRHSSLPKDEQRHMVPLNYPVKSAMRTMRGAGKRLGITKTARRFLS